MNKFIITLNNVTCGYHGKTVLTDITLAIAAGEMVGIIGPNGAGKTTLLKTLAGQLKPRQGDITVASRPLSEYSGKELAAVMAVVGQTVPPSLLTVREHVLLGRLPFFRRYQLFETARDFDIADRYMELTGISDLAGAPMNEISGGERQLAAITRALVQEPKILLLDEPTSHLDITHQQRIMDLIAGLNRDLALTVVMVMHDLNLAGEYTGRLILLNGREKGIHLAGPAETVLTPETIRAVYRTEVLVTRNPVSGKPGIFLSARQSDI
ncbi:MAG: ABC transporter ATP-binding protein [Thermodesulfobacteriota bacterium]